jgi:hypothetical protein
MKHLAAPLALLVLAGAAGCADPSRVDAVEAGLARVRAEGTLRDQKLVWLHDHQMILAAYAVRRDEREALAKRIAALEAENAALLQRLSRAERRIEAAGGDAHAGPARALDEQIPYELASHHPDGSPAAPAPDHTQPPRRTLDERVPY